MILAVLISHVLISIVLVHFVYSLLKLDVLQKSEFVLGINFYFLLYFLANLNRRTTGL